MSERPIDRLMERVRKAELPTRDALQTADVAAVEKGRDPAFEGRWQRVYDRVNAREKEKGLPDADKDLVDRVRERVYLAVWDATDDPQLSAYASDDFDLFARAVALGVEDGWLAALAFEYRQGKFPAGSIQEQNDVDVASALGVR